METFCLIFEHINEIFFSSKLVHISDVQIRPFHSFIDILELFFITDLRVFMFDSLTEIHIFILILIVLKHYRRCE